MTNELNGPGPKNVSFEEFCGKLHGTLSPANRLILFNRWKEQQASGTQSPAEKIEKELIVRFGSVAQAPAIERSRLQREIDATAPRAPVIDPALLPAVQSLPANLRQIVGGALQKRNDLQREHAQLAASDRKNITAGTLNARLNRMAAIEAEVADLTTRFGLNNL